MNSEKLKSVGFIGLVLMIIIVFPYNLRAENTIIWVNDQLEPAFISEGKDKGNGIVDGVVELYKRHLTEYEHRHVVANMPRILDLMKKGENVCYAGFFRTPEREKFVEFSLPNLINYMGAMVVKKDNPPKAFESVNQLSLTNLLSETDLTLGLTKDRSYGQVIDSIIQNVETGQKNLFFRVGQDSLRGLLEMLYFGRIDYTIGFPWEIPYVAQKIGKKDAFKIVFISEGKDDRWIKNYIGAPNTPWGKRLIKRINEILIEVRPTESHMVHQLKWFPQNIEQEIRKAYAQKILSVTE